MCFNFKKVTPAQFKQMYSLMEESFPEYEHRTYSEQEKLLSNPNYCAYVLENENTVIAFVAVFCFKKFCFIEHIAVLPEYRNNGLGAAMLKQIRKISKGPICLEVELPDSPLSSRRIEFYKRNGFYLNEYSYIQPSMTAGQKSIPLMIMTSDEKITEDEFTYIRSVLYSRVYNLK